MNLVLLLVHYLFDFVFGFHLFHFVCVLVCFFVCDQFIVFHCLFLVLQLFHSMSVWFFVLSIFRVCLISSWLTNSFIPQLVFFALVFQLLHCLFAFRLFHCVLAFCGSSIIFIVCLDLFIRFIVR